MTTPGGRSMAGKAAAPPQAARTPSAPSPVRFRTPRELEVDGGARELRTEATSPDPRLAFRFGKIPIQAKLVVGREQDPLEVEADRTAEQVMRMTAPDQADAVKLRAPANVARQTSGVPEEAAPKAPEEEEEDEKEPAREERPSLHRKAAGGTDGTAPTIVHEVLRSPGQPLDAGARAFMEPRFGFDFSKVRVHTDARAEASARAVHALAYTAGSDVVFAPGRYAPATTAGRHLLAHELAHVVQQSAVPAAPVVRRQPGEEPIVEEHYGLKLEQWPSEGEARLSFRGILFAVFFWEKAPGRRLPGLVFGAGKDLGFDGADTLTVGIQSEFAVDATVDGRAEQAIASSYFSYLGASLKVTHHLKFPGSVTYRTTAGDTEAKPADFGYQYWPAVGELMPKKDPEPIAPGPDPFKQPEKPPKPKAWFPKVWTFDDKETIDDFAASHSTNKWWAEVRTREGKYVAWALTIDAITGMADKVRNKQHDFGFLRDYSGDEGTVNLAGGEVVGVFVHGEKLPAVDALADLYFRSVDKALEGYEGALPECEISKMEEGRFKRTGLGHSQAMVRWRQIQWGDDNPLTVLVPSRVSVDPNTQEITETPDPSKKVVRSNRVDFVALRVLGDKGMQTIYPESLKDPSRKAELKGDFTGFDPVGDGLEAPAPDLPYEKVERLLKKLLGRKRDVVEGREPPDDIGKIGERIDELMARMHELGVNLDEERLQKELAEGRDLRQVKGVVAVSPAPPYFFGERFTFRLALDYVPPTASVKVHWRWKAKGREAQFIEAPDNRGLLGFTLGDFLFWNAAPDNDIGKNNGFEVLAYVYLNNAEAPVSAPITSGWIPLGARDIVPEKLTIAGDKVVVKGARADFRLAEWVPVLHDFSVDWTNMGNVLAADRAVLTASFPTVGKIPLKASVYRVERGFGGIKSKALVREAALDVEVQDPQAAGESRIEEMKKQKLPGLAAVESSMDMSVFSLEKKVAAGGGQQPYWEKRLEAQKKRLASLRDLAPGLKNDLDLPADPLALDENASYSAPVLASLVLPTAGGAQPLAVHLTVHKAAGKWKVRLLDLTSAEVLKFDGEGDQLLDAYTDAFKTWDSNNPYPKNGMVVYSFAPAGWTLGKSFSTYRVGKVVKEWVDGILMIGGIVVAGLLLAAPDATITKVLGGVLLAASVARGTVQIAENISLGMSVLDSRNVLEAVGIITAFAGVSGTLLRTVGVSAVRPLVYRVGSWLVLASVAADSATLVYVSGAVISQIRAVEADPTLDDDQRVLSLLQLVSTLVLQNAMFFVANKEMFKGGLKKSDYFATDPKVTAEGVRTLPPGEVKLETGARLDVAAELRKAGEAPRRLQPDRVTDAQLVERYFALPWLDATLSKAASAELLNRLETPALKALSDIPASRVKSLADHIDDDVTLNALAPLLEGSGLSDLVDAVGGRRTRDLRVAFGAEGTAGLVKELGGGTLGKLLNGPQPMTAVELKAHLEHNAPAIIKTLSNHMSGSEVSTVLSRLEKLRTVEEPARVQESLAKDEAFKQRKEDVRKLLADRDQVAKDLASADISQERFEQMMHGDADHAGERLPLAFKDYAQYEQFKKELATLLERIRVDGKPITAEARAIGSSTSFYSGNPDKPLGHHYDRKGPGTGDMDVDLFSPELTRRMLQNPRAAANPKVLVAGERTIFKNDGVGGFHGEFPEFKDFKDRWSHTLGREVDVKLKLDLSPISAVPQPTAGPGPIEFYRRE